MAVWNVAWSLENLIKFQHNTTLLLIISELATLVSSEKYVKIEEYLHKYK